MWIARLKIKHDCVIGNRCRKFGVTTTGTPFSVYERDGVTYSPQVQTLHGPAEQISLFIEDLQKDPAVRNLETEGNTVFFLEVRKEEKVTASIFSRLGPQIIFVKPVFVDTKGYEYWEIATWQKALLSEFIAGVKREVSKDVEIKRMEETKLTDIYFSRLMPKLSEHQKRAITLAFEHGYYQWPKQTGFGELAKLMKVSVPTFREHLKRAEQKLMPDLLHLLE